MWLQPIEVKIYSNYEGTLNFVRSLEQSSKVILLIELDFKPVKPVNEQFFN